MSSPVGTPPIPSWEMETSEEAKASRGVVSSSDSSQPGSGGGRSNEKKKRVGFTGGDDSNGRSPRVSWIGPEDGTSTSPEQAFAHGSPDNSFSNTPTHSRSNSGEMPLPRSISRSHLPELTPQQTQEIHQALARSPTVTKPRPAIRRTQSNHGQATLEDEDEDEAPFDDQERAHREDRMRKAFEEAKRLEDQQRSAPASRQNSPERGYSRRFETEPPLDDIPPEEKAHRDRESDSEDDDMLTLKRSRARTYREAERLVRKHTMARREYGNDGYVSAFQSGAATPTEEQDYATDYRPRPDHYRDGFLSSLLGLYKNRQDSDGGHSRNGSMARLLPRTPRSRQGSETATPPPSPPQSGASTPTGRRWFARKQRDRSAPSLTQLIGSSASLGSPLVSGLGEKVNQTLKEQKEEEKRAGIGKSSSATALAALNRVTGHQRRREEEIKITLHIAETIARQGYLMKLCRALMMYGAPTHRLEEYMRMSARVLEIDAQFLYIPGSMIMSFDDSNTHTTEVKLVRVSQGLDLGKLRDVHEIYKDVVHDRIGVVEATQRLKDVTSSKPKHSRWIRIPVYGVAAASVGPFAFQARMIDLPIIFFLGCILGVLQLVVAPASDLYANVFEVSAAVITSFLSRAFGSIWNGDSRLFCFSALAQSSIALILPGYIVLSASLELQSKSIVAGSVRMVYAIIYSLFLGFGITIGTAIYGLMDGAASSETTCVDPLPSKWYFIFVPIFALSLIVIHQAKWKQAPVMLVIALVGYVVNFFSARRFVGNTQVSNTLGALAIGVLANLYSRMIGRVENWGLDRWEDDLRPYWRKLRKQFFHTDGKNNSPKTLEEGGAADDESVFERQRRRVGYGLAVAAMLPAIFVQVPSGLSANGSLVSGIASANQIAGNATNGTTVLNTATITSASSGIQTNSIAFTVSYSVVQVAIGITVGLFLSAIVVYPFGKRRSGLFSL